MKNCIFRAALALIFFVNSPLRAQSSSNKTVLSDSQLKAKIAKKWADHQKSSADLLQIRKKINLAGGDMAAIYNTCPKPRGWRPADSSLDKAQEWDIVPTYVPSVTYPQKRGGSRIHFSPFEPEDKKADSQKKQIECDYVTVQFQNNTIKKVDRKNCPQLSLRAASFERCRELLGL